MRPIVTLNVVLVSAFFGQAPAVAQVIHYVDSIQTCKNKTPCYGTIMDAVNAALPSDVIEVFPGVYHESVVFDRATKSDITLRARSARQKPIITGLVEVASRVQVLHFVLEGGVTQNSVGSPHPAEMVVHGNSISGTVHFFKCDRGTVSNNEIRGNVELFDSKNFLVEGNVIIGGGISIGGIFDSATGYVIRRNVIRFSPENGIRIGNFQASENLVEDNFVSGSARSGIAVGGRHGEGNFSEIRRNTSIENTLCDLSDLNIVDGPPNLWIKNRSVTKCGNVPDQ